MEFKELVRLSRSCRGYDEARRLTKEELLELVDCARLGPSSGNLQPLKYRLAWQPEEVAAVQAQTRWAAALPQMHLPHAGMCPTAFVVICQDTAIDPNTARFQRDVGAAAQTMLLAAAERGLGGCMIGSFNAAALRGALHLPDTLPPQLVVAFGKPAETVVLTEAAPGAPVAYYRDEADVHYVPKRRLADVVIDADGAAGE